VSRGCIFSPQHLGLATFTLTNGLILILPVTLAVKVMVILSLESFTLFTLLVAIVKFGPRQ